MSNPTIPVTPAGQTLLRELLVIPKPTDEQKRFTGSLRKALGQLSNNDLRKQR